MTGAALVYSSSLIAAFLGGILALFAPCCVVSLMPTFVGVALRQGRLRLPITTTLFAAGVAAVLLPVVLGIGALGALLAAHHRIVYFGVAFVLLAIGFSALIGRGCKEGAIVPALCRWEVQDVLRRLATGDYLAMAVTNVLAEIRHRQRPRHGGETGWSSVPVSRFAARADVKIQERS